MDKQSNSTTVPENSTGKRSGKEFISAMFDIEGAVHSLRHMAAIAADRASDALGDHRNIAGCDVTITKHKDDWDTILFAVNEVDRRAEAPRDAFVTALKRGGE